MNGYVTTIECGFFRIDWLPVPAICENWSSHFVFDPGSLDSKVLEVNTRTVRHPIHLAMEFKKLLDGKLVNSRGELAEPYGLSRARVTPLMKLLTLLMEIEEYLVSLTGEKEVRLFSERKFRPLLALQNLEARNRHLKCL